MTEDAATLAPHVPSDRRQEQRWLLVGGLLLAAAILVLVAYYPTVTSAVDLWTHHKTYGYAFVVLPIVAFLVWRDRNQFKQTSPAPTIHGAAIALLFAALWYAGVKLNVLEMQHVALSGMLVALVVTAIGWASARNFWLPLAYLFLLAPAGTPILPYLQSITTFIAEIFLGIGQIPFYANGYRIEVVTGQYEIAPGCAGLNFVLALATVAPLFTVLMYNTWPKRLVVLALMMAIVPIANGFRVFAIIAIAEYTNRAIDIAADHLLYGWLFFSVVVLAMFWLGSRFADPISPELDSRQTPTASVFGPPVLRRLIVALTATTAICLAPSFLAANHLISG